MSDLEKSEKSNKIDFLSEVIEKNIISFDKKREANRKQTFLFTMSLSFFSASVTILLGLHGLEGDKKELILNFALIISAFVTIISAWESLFSPRDTWLRYTQTSNELRELKYRLKYLITSGKENIKVEDIDFLYEKYQSILKDNNSRWTGLKERENKGK